MGTLEGKTILITGGSRGIGQAIALRCAIEGANIAIAAKTAQPHPKLSGTIYTVAEEVEKLGGKALPLQVDIRDEKQIQAAVEKTVATFGGIDILINNASAISLTGTLDTTMKKYDLMNQVNARGTFACSQACLPHLLKSENPHILTLSPPLSLKPKWFKEYVAYTISKYGMSMCTLGMAEEFKDKGIAINCLWPKTTIATAAIEVHFPKEILRASRVPLIMADAAFSVITKDCHQFSGNFFIDEDVLRADGMTEFSKYAINKDTNLCADLYVDFA